MKMAFDVLEQIKQNLDAINGYKVCLQVLYTQECVRREKELSHFRAFFDRKRSNTRVGGHFRGGKRKVQTRIPSLRFRYITFNFYLNCLQLSCRRVSHLDSRT